MNTRNHGFFKRAFAFAMFSATLACAHAQTSPPGGVSTEPLRLVVGFAPGGALDILARAVAEHLRKSTGQTVLVENRPGASSRLAIDYVKRAPPDGNTVLLASSAPFIIFPMTYKQVNYDVERDFVPVAHLVEFASVISTSPAKPYKTLPQFVSWVRGHPADGLVGLTSLGGGLHFAILAMGKEIGVPLSPVAYRGGAPLATDIVGGQVPIGTDALPSQLELHRGGRVRILAVSGTRRNKLVPDIPTAKEAGINGFDHATFSYSAYVPAGTPPAVTQRLERALVAAVKERQVYAQLLNIGMEPTGLDGATLKAQLRAERAFWRPIVEASGFKSEE
jgi:tripartite-type tricarboxylate transporter receptor subunit TctC